MLLPTRAAATRVAALFVLALTCAGGPIAASAQGTITITHVKGDVESYPNAKVQIVHSTVNVTAADGKGTLVIYRAACRYQGEVMVCLPTAVSVVESSGVHALNLLSGTVFLNLTGTTQQLSLSTTKLPPNGVLMTLQTKRGTYINVVGQIDKVTK
jgi:hypothetical protein